MYIQLNTGVPSRNHCCSANSTMRSASVVELHVTANYKHKVLYSKYFIADLCRWLKHVRRSSCKVPDAELKKERMFVR
jgi:hypothetical protein